MAVSSRTQRVLARLEAADLYWGRGHCRTITYVADSTGSLNDTYHDLNVYDASGVEKAYYVWYNVNAGGTDPAVANKTGIEVAVATDATAAAVASATKAALEAASVEVFIGDSTAGALSLENWYPGVITAETDSGSTGFTFAVDQAGFGGYLGASAEAIEVSSEVNLVDIQANQFGGQILDQVISGTTMSISVSLLEMTDQRWADIVGQGVGAVNSDGSTDVVGFGESKNFQNLSDQDGRLIIHPKRIADGDRSADWVFWRSAPVPESFAFDGNAPQSLAVTFTAYLDSGRDKKVNLAARGDWTQSELFA